MNGNRATPRGTHPLSLAHLTFLELSPPEFIRVAGQAGFEAVGLRLIAVTNTTPGYDLMGDTALLRETQAAMRETGVRINDIEFVRMTPTFDPVRLKRFVEVGQALGARYIVTAPYDPDLARLADNLARFCDMAAGFGLMPVLEFFPWTNVPNLPAALDVVNASGRASLGVLLDTLHFDRSASRISDIASADPARFPFIHLCDAPVLPEYSEHDLLHTARAARLMPGDGQIGLQAILDHIPDGIPIGLEVPLFDRTGQTPAQIAAQLYEKTQTLLSGSGLVALKFRSPNSFRQPFVRRPRDFSHPATSAVDADYRTH